MANENEINEKNGKELDIEDLEKMLSEDDFGIDDDFLIDDDFFNEDQLLNEDDLIPNKSPKVSLKNVINQRKDKLTKTIRLLNKNTLNANKPFSELLGKEILLTLEADQLNMLGQTFRPVFCGKLVEVTNGFITLFPVTIKMPNAPFFQNSFPLSFPINTIATFVPFNCATKFPIN